MKKDLPFCFAFVVCLFPFNAQATTVPLDPYLMVSTTTSPIDVSYRDSPYSPTADHPEFRPVIGKLRTTFSNSWFSLSVLDKNA
ncbi:MAG: hypothetical protein M3P47_07515, partial [Pseudomonadota bacterium]|nr:hypothetical protein [Pseudomonadota bacterium]